MHGKRLPPELRKKREDRIVALLAEGKNYGEIIATLKQEHLGCSTSDIVRVKRGLGVVPPISKPRRSENETNFWRGLRDQLDAMGVQSLIYDGDSFSVSRTSTVTIKVKKS